MVLLHLRCEMIGSAKFEAPGVLERLAGKNNLNTQKRIQARRFNESCRSDNFGYGRRRGSLGFHTGECSIISLFPKVTIKSYPAILLVLVGNRIRLEPVDYSIFN